MTDHERPGVYSAIDVSAVYASGSDRRVVALAGPSEAEAGVYRFRSWTQARAGIGEDCRLGAMLKLAFQNGAGTVLAYPVAADTAAAYTAAVTALLAQKEPRLLAVGSQQSAVLAAVKTAVMTASEERGECIAAASVSGKTVSQCCDLALGLNCERMVLIGTGVTDEDGTLLDEGLAAAALCGVLAAGTDPALPLHGAALRGLSGTDGTLSDDEADTLITGGVTCLETTGQGAVILRAVTTRTQTAGVSDFAWREITTVEILDDVIPALRSSLRARFARSKNNAVTRNAIRSQVTVELQDRVDRGILDSFGNLQVAPSAEDPSVCEVSFGFTVVHGLSRILLTAHISI